MTVAPTSQIFDLQRFAQQVAAAKGTLPDALGNLLRGYGVLTSPAATEDPANAILDAVVDGSLTEAKLQKMLPPAALADKTGEFRAGLAGRAERMCVQRWYRELEKGAADQILDSLRPEFDRHVEAIAEAKACGINAESTLETLIATGEPGLVGAWNNLGAHVQGIAKIAAVASEFGCQPKAMFPQVRAYTPGHVHLLDDRALMCCDGGLLGDSSLFRRPDQGHRTSPYFRTPLKLRTIAEAQQWHDLWAAEEFDRIHVDRPRGGRIIDGVMVQDPVPVNPFKAKANA